MRTHSLYLHYVFNTFPLRQIKEWWMAVDKVLVVELLILVGLIFTKIYVNARYIYEKNSALSLQRELKLEEGKIKKLKVELENYRNVSRLKELSKSMNMEDEIEVIVVK